MPSGPRKPTSHAELWPLDQAYSVSDLFSWPKLPRVTGAILRMRRDSHALFVLAPAPQSDTVFAIDRYLRLGFCTTLFAATPVRAAPIVMSNMPTNRRAFGHLFART